MLPSFFEVHQLEDRVMFNPDVVLCQEEGGLINYEPQLRDLALSLSESVAFRTIYL